MTQVGLRLLKRNEINWPGFVREEEGRLIGRTAMNMRGYGPAVARIETDKVGSAAAEEMFDLTNNPNRQAERERQYGIGPSMSSGDIAEVDGVAYLCLSFGWVQL